MFNPRFTKLAALCTVAAFAVFARSASANTFGGSADTLTSVMVEKNQLPSALAGVTDIRFSDFFVMPVGPLGLEHTAKIKALDGKRVRILGYMVRQGRGSPGVALLAPYTLATIEGEMGPSEDLPISTLFVTVPKFADLAVPYTPGPLLLTGRLELGRREEGEGRVSFIRLTLDPEPAEAASVNAPSVPAAQPASVSAPVTPPAAK